MAVLDIFFLNPPEKGGDVGEEHFVAQICGQVAVVELES